MKFIIGLVLLSVLVSCGSTRQDSDKIPCMSKKNNNFTIRWGEYIAENDSYMGYQIDVFGDLSLYRKSKDVPEKIEPISRLDYREVCKTIDLANRIVVKNLALYVPAPKANFIQYTVPEDNMYIIAIWNPKFDNKGNHDYRVLFDSLNLLVPSAKYLKK